MKTASVFTQNLPRLKLDSRVIQWMNTTMGPSQTKLPTFLSKASAGFPSPADDYIDDNRTLDELLIDRPASTFMIRVKGDSMIDEQIQDNDLLIVDRSLPPQNGKIAVIAIDGQVTVKKLSFVDQKLFLLPANSSYQPIEVNEENDVVIWGIVTSIIHQV